MSDKIEEFYRDATADDVARVMRGERVEIRVRDDDDDDWRYGEYLGGVHRGNCEEFKWKDRDGVPWKQCQVYDPPAWFLNKPDPGEGYRLLEKFPPEEPQEGDQVKRYDEPNSEWVTLKQGFDPGQRNSLWYRRRIANNPTSSDSCERQKLEAGKEYLLPSGMVLIVNSESVEVAK